MNHPQLQQSISFTREKHRKFFKRLCDEAYPAIADYLKGIVSLASEIAYIEYFRILLLILPARTRKHLMERFQGRVLSQAAFLRFIPSEYQTPEILAYRQVLLEAERAILEIRDNVPIEASL